MNFQLTDGSSVIRLDDGATIPDDPRNADWQAYQAWLAAGNMPLAALPAPPAPKIPPTPRQWLERLAPATQTAITKAATGDTTGGLLLWLLKAAGNPTIDVTSQETAQGVQALVTAGIITAADEATLLAP